MSAANGKVAAYSIFHSRKVTEAEAKAHAIHISEYAGYVNTLPVNVRMHKINSLIKSELPLIGYSPKLDKNVWDVLMQYRAAIEPDLFYAAKSLFERYSPDVTRFTPEQTLLDKGRKLQSKL